MFTYLLQPRRIRILSGAQPTFPAPASLTFLLAPEQLFGCKSGPIRAVRLGSAYEVIWNASTDRSYGRPDPGFSRLHLSVNVMGGVFEVDGNEVSFRTEVQSEQQLIEYLQLLHFALPSSLSALLPDPVYITRVEGTIGGTEFRVEHSRHTGPLAVLDDARLTEYVTRALSDIARFAEDSGRRLLAATGYVHNARRLLAVGYSPWEFMAEALLNYSKALEVLFGDSRDEQRTGLRAIGVAEAAIDARLIPVTLLRDFLDVGHPKLSQVDGPRLTRLYLFLVGLEGDFQDVLRKAHDAIAAGKWVPAPARSETLKPAELRILDRILTEDEAHRQAKARQGNT